MKNLSLTLISLMILASLSSCGVSGTYIYNLNESATQVTLASSNFKILERVNGSSEVDYVLIFGGMNKRQLYADAYKKMVDAANLESGSKALINMVTEEHIGGVPPFSYTRTITVSAHVVEFNK